MFSTTNRMKNRPLIIIKPLAHKKLNPPLATESMKSSKLKRHLESKHISCAKKPKDYFETLLKYLNKEKNFFEKFITVNEKYLLASYKVSYCIAKNEEPFTNGEDLVLLVLLKW